MKTYSEEFKLKRKIKELKRKESWLPYLPKNPTCAICNKELKYFSGNRKNCVHFDHHSEGLSIKWQPTTWLAGHNPTSENIKTWRSCDFKTLCVSCNSFLPTKNRKEFVEKIYKYVFDQ